MRDGRKAGEGRNRTQHGHCNDRRALEDEEVREQCKAECCSTHRRLPGAAWPEVLQRVMLLCFILMH